MLTHMSPRLGLVLLVSTMLFTPTSAIGEPTKPVAAIAIASDPTAIVSWIPGIEAPDAYRVYGVQGESMSLLSSVAGDVLNTEVAGHFPAYAVTAVTDGIESAPTLTGSASSDGCLTIRTDPPSVDVGNCGLGGGDGGNGRSGGGGGLLGTLRRQPAILM